MFLASRSALLEIAGNESLAEIAGLASGRDDIAAVRQYEFINSFFRLSPTTDRVR